MKKLYSMFSLFIITFMFFGVVNVKAENTYRAYKFGEVIEAQVDKSGHKGTFIVIGDSPTTSDEVVVIQKNGGLDATVKDLKIKYTDDGKEKIIEKVAVNNATVRTSITLGMGQTDNLLDTISNEFNGYVRIDENHDFGVMTYLQYHAMLTEYGQDKIDAAFKGQKYWLNNGAVAGSDGKPLEPNFTDNDTYKINGANNSFDVTSDGQTTSYGMNLYGRLVNGQYKTQDLYDDSEGTNETEYEPAIILTLCKPAIVVPPTENPPTADMNIIMLSVVGILSLGVVVLTTKRIISIK